MGRPPNCGCCGVSEPPVSVCSSVSGYFQVPWVEEVKTNCNISSGTYSFYGEPYEKINVRWSFGDTVNSGDYSCISEYATEIPNNAGISGFLCSGYYYNFIIKKPCYFNSGVLIKGKINGFTSFINSKISINDGTEHNIVSIYGSTNSNNPVESDLGYNSCCRFEYCEIGEYTTKNSGCYIITVSGSTNNKNLYDEKVWIASSGNIEYSILPNGNNDTLDLWQCEFDFLTRDALYRDSCTCGHCCYYCQDCVHMFYIGQIPSGECMDFAPYPGCPSGGYAYNRFEPASSCENLAACCINGVCYEYNCKTCSDLGGTWHPTESCFGQNPKACGDPI